MPRGRDPPPLSRTLVTTDWRSISADLNWVTWAWVGSGLPGIDAWSVMASPHDRHTDLPSCSAGTAVASESRQWGHWNVMVGPGLIMGPFGPSVAQMRTKARVDGLDSAPKSHRSSSRSGVVSGSSHLNSIQNSCCNNTKEAAKTPVLRRVVGRRSTEPTGCLHRTDTIHRG